MDIGSTLADMHDFRGDGPNPFRKIKKPHRIVSHHRYLMRGGAEFINKAVKAKVGERYFAYINKLLTVVDVEPGVKSHTLVCAYSYDDILFGLMEVVVDD